MIWEKLGRILFIDGNHEWMNSHSALPTPMHLHGDVFRIFFSTRDTSNRSHGGYVDIDINNFNEILNMSTEPVLTPGRLGLFDDSGVSLACYVKEANLFYYMGWNLMKTVPFSNQIGVAHLKDNSKLERVSILPVLGKTLEEPFSFGYPWILKKDNKFFMWYDTNLNWANNSTEDYKFIIRCATSEDGIHWNKTHVTCLEPNEGERSIARPCVIFENGLFKMWYSINLRGKYILGYSESNDGFKWTRKDSEVGLTTSSEGWDSDEVEYPCVFDHKGVRYMLYNGNGYGKTGFGLARLKT